MNFSELPSKLWILKKSLIFRTMDVLQSLTVEKTHMESHRVRHITIKLSDKRM